METASLVRLINLRSGCLVWTCCATLAHLQLVAYVRMYGTKCYTVYKKLTLYLKYVLPHGVAQFLSHPKIPFLCWVPNSMPIFCGSLCLICPLALWRFRASLSAAL
jgi:hypothetical protein